MTTQRILVGEIGRPHGVRGLVRVQSFTAEPAAIAGYGPLSDESGERCFVLEWLSGGLARIDGITDRDAAAKLTGTRLYVDRDRLPPPAEEEFYLADLVGLTARDAGGQEIGQVRAVEDFGAGSFLTILTEAGKEVLVPFTRAAVPEVRVAEGWLVAVPPGEGALPEGVEAEPAQSPMDDAHALPRRQDVPRRGNPRPPRGGVIG
ncbi:ribosome maturation factor RimM [Roseomonas marmotae]|uniref:Ribosome maturation factor RimM n=1 Tax=Roseomonas marmotae TaxID=2768161 RepID=A0ABS3KEX5_9PROT|nr:ribosome maturation factor RimM [Roseomonas marmotae]MBO1076019.1 16S rRNA processing protein RimM [Roseomonas marmotae]QTI80150.1 16S rRNA processing protein RimM [Roseomonas marmotae]